MWTNLRNWLPVLLTLVGLAVGWGKFEERISLNQAATAEKFVAVQAQFSMQREAMDLLVARLNGVGSGGPLESQLGQLGLRGAVLTDRIVRLELQRIEDDRETNRREVLLAQSQSEMRTVLMRLRDDVQTLGNAIAGLQQQQRRSSLSDFPASTN